MRYITALMITTIFILAACSKPSPKHIDWDSLAYGASGIELPPQQEYEHATK